VKLDVDESFIFPYLYLVGAKSCLGVLTLSCHRNPWQNFASLRYNRGHFFRQLGKSTVARQEPFPKLLQPMSFLRALEYGHLISLLRLQYLT
jgi:hypothetical protein